MHGCCFVTLPVRLPLHSPHHMRKVMHRPDQEDPFPTVSQPALQAHTLAAQNYKDWLS